MPRTNTKGPESTVPPAKSPIVAVLNCYEPANGANRCQLIVRADDSAEFFGERALAKAPLAALRKVDRRALRYA